MTLTSSLRPWRIDNGGGVPSPALLQQALLVNSAPK